MRLSVLRAIPSVLIMTGFAAVFLSYYDSYLYDQGQLPYPAVKLFLLALAAVSAWTFVRIAASKAVRNEVIALYLAHRPVIIGLTGVVLASFVSGFIPTAYWEDGPRYVRYPAYDTLIILLSMLLPFPEHRRRLFWPYFLVGFAVALGSVLIDTIHPGTYSVYVNRAAGFIQNPNAAAFLLVALCASIISFERVRPIDLAVLLATAIGVLGTFSRGGGLVFGVLVLCYAYFAIIQVRERPLRALGRVLAIVLLGALTVQAARVLISRAEIFDAESRLGILFGRQKVIPTHEPRVEALKESLQLVRESPVLGMGSGFTYKSMRKGAEPHNIYLQQWINNGLLGLVAYLWTLGAAGYLFWKRRHRNGMVFVALVAIQGLFSHNLLEERVFLVPLGVLLTLSFYAAPARVTAARAREVAPPPHPLRSAPRRAGLAAGARASQVRPAGIPE